MSDLTFSLADLKSSEGDAFTLRDLKSQPYDVHPGVRSAMNIGQAVTFGFGDEIAGMMGADKGRYRATIDQFRKDYPGSAALGTISGAMLLPLGAGRVAANPWGTAATVGALTGAAQGAGDAESLKDVPNDASRGFLIGAALGPVMLGATNVAGSVAGTIANHAGSRLPFVSDSVTNLLARNRIGKAFERDNIAPDEVANTLRTLGPEARIADAGGESTRRLLDTNATLPGQTKNTLESAIDSRIAGRADRMNPIVDMVGDSQGRASEVFNRWQAQKETAAAPLYARFRARQIAGDPELQGLVNIADRQGLFKEAATLADYGTATGGQPFTLISGKSPGTYNPSDLDYLKRAVDNQIQAAMNKGNNNAARLIGEYRALLVKKIDELSGNTYKPALDAFAGPAQLQAALQNGRKFLTGDADSLGITMSGMSSSEQDAFRIGASEALRNKFGSQSGQTEFLNAWKNRNIREKLQALLGDDVKYGDVMSILRGENTLKKLEGVGRGSQTAAREAGMEDQTAGVASDALNLVGAAKMGAWPSMLGGLNRFSARLGTPEPVRDRIGQILLQKARMDEEIKAVLAAQQAMRQNAAFAGAATGVAGGRVPGLLD